MATFLYPTTQQLVQIAKLKENVLTNDDPVFRLFPIQSRDASSIAWEQQDYYLGLQQLRGLDGSPTRVKKLGARRYVYEPGYYGEFEQIDEAELTLRRPFGASNEVTIDISDLVMDAQDKLIARRISRWRQIMWTLLVTGTFSITLPTGRTGHTDTYSIQTYTASDWSTPGTATPLADFRGVSLLARGVSTNFGQGATAFMNRTTYNYLITNTNAADLGRLTLYGQMGLLGEGEFQRLFLSQDLPSIIIYDDGYYDDAGSFNLFIPNDKVVVVGTRPAGQSVGNYILTRNANNPNMEPGVYQKVFDRGEENAGGTVPRTIDVHDGHNGGPLLWFPGSIVVMSV